jgi:hypothetical protein
LVAAIAATTLLSACSGLLGLFGKDDPVKKTVTLADAMVDEMIAEFGSSAAAGARGITADGSILDDTQKAAMKAYVKAKIAAALSATEKTQTDKIISVMIKAVASYVEENGATLAETSGSADIVLVKVVAVAARAAVKSAAAEGRQDLVSTDAATGTKKTIETVLAESTQTAVQSMMDNVKDDTIKQEAVGLTVQTAVAAMGKADTINSANLQTVIQATVKASTEAVVASSAAGNAATIQDMVKQVTSGVIQAAAALPATLATDTVKQAVVAESVNEAVKAVIKGAGTNDALKDSAFAQNLIGQVVAGASEAVQKANVGAGAGAVLNTSSLATDAAAAVTKANAEITAAGGTTAVTVVMDMTVLNAIVNETAPTIASATISALVGTGTVAAANGALTLGAAPTSLTFSASATPGTGKTAVLYSWIRTSGPTALALGDGPSFTIATDTTFRPGRYEFQLKATNLDGVKSATATVVVNCSYAASLAQVAYAKGMFYLKQRAYDAAYLQFADSVSLDSSVTSEIASSAKLWKAVLEISKLSIDPAIVDLAKNKFGFIDYPTTMEELFTDRWLTSSQFYTNKNYIKLTPQTAGNTWGYIPLRFVASSAFPKIDREIQLTDGSTYYQWVDAYVATSTSADGSINADNMDGNSRGYFTASGTPNCYVYHNDSVPTSTLDANGSPVTAQASSLYADLSSAQFYNYDWIENFVPAIAPRMAMPAGIDASLFKDLWDLYPEDKDDDNVLPASLQDRFPLYAIPQIVMANVVNNFGSGINGLVDAVVSGPLAKLDSVVQTIESIPDGIEIAIPLDLVQAYRTLDEKEIQLVQTYAKLNSAYLKTFAAEIMIDKCFLEMFSAYDLSYDMNKLKPMLAQFNEWDASAYDTKLKAAYDANNNGIPDPVENFFATADSPFKTMMTVRNAARLTQAKASMKKAFSLLQEALTEEEARLGNFADTLPVGGSTDAAGNKTVTYADVAQLTNAFKNVKALFKTIELSLDSGAAAGVPKALFSNPMALLDADYDWTAKGVAADRFEMKPAQLFATTTVGGKTVGALSPLLAFAKDANGDFLEDVDFGARVRRWSETGSSWNVPLGTFSLSDPTEAAEAAALYEVCVDYIVEDHLQPAPAGYVPYTDPKTGENVHFQELSLKISLPLDSAYADFLGFPKGSLDGLGLPFGGPWVGGEYIADPAGGYDIFSEARTRSLAATEWESLKQTSAWMTK